MDDDQINPAPTQDNSKPSSSVNKALAVTTLLFLAILVAGGAYFLGSSKTDGTQEAETPTPTPTSQITPLPEAISPTATLSATPTATPLTTEAPTTFKVTGITAAVAPTSSTACSPNATTFNFSATITANAAGDVTYKWERSDGALASEKILSFTSAGSKTLTTTWSISRSSGQTYNGWERVKVSSPNSLTSNEANFSVSCP